MNAKGDKLVNQGCSPSLLHSHVSPCFQNLIISGHQIYQNQQPLSLTALYPSSAASSRHGAVGLPLQQQPPHQHPHEAALSSASEMPTSGSSNASPTCMTNWAAVSTSNNNNHNNSKVKIHVSCFR